MEGGATMTVKYYQRVLLSEQERAWDSSCGAGLWIETYRRRDEIELVRKLVKSYLSGKSPTYVLGSDCNALELINWFLDVLVEMPIMEVVSLVRDVDYVLKESVENVPQISSYEISTDAILKLLSASERNMDFEEIGYHLNPKGKDASKVARRKYGENCSKFAALLDLVEIKRTAGVSLTNIGKALSVREDCADIYPRLFFKLALFRDFICCSSELHRNKFLATIESLSESTKARRASAFSVMFSEFCRAGGEVEDETYINKLLWNMRR